MTTFNDLDNEILAGLERHDQRRANTLGATGWLVEEPFGRAEFIDGYGIYTLNPISSIFSGAYAGINNTLEASVNNFAAPYYQDCVFQASYTSGQRGTIGTRRVAVPLHSLVTSGKTGLASIQTFVAVFAAPISDMPDDVNAVRVKRLIPSDKSFGRSTADEAVIGRRGFELALYPAANVGGFLQADTSNGPIPTTSDPSSDAYGVGNKGIWTVDCVDGIVRLTVAPGSGDGYLFNPNNVFGEWTTPGSIGSTITYSPSGRITLFATFYEYTGPDLYTQLVVNAAGNENMGNAIVGLGNTGDAGVFIAQTPNNNGADGYGFGAGYGLYGQGGGTGDGILGVGGLTSGNGVDGYGTGHGYGGYFIGHGTGDGVYGVDSSSGFGGHFAGSDGSRAIKADGYIALEQISAPASFPAGYGILYTESDGNLYFKSSTYTGGANLVGVPYTGAVLDVNLGSHSLTATGHLTSPNGIDGYGFEDGYGVYGQGSITGGDGVVGKGTGNGNGVDGYGAGLGYGVYGKGSVIGSDGVVGQGTENGNGVDGYSAGLGYGVYGLSTSGTGGFFTGSPAIIANALVGSDGDGIDATGDGAGLGGSFTGGNNGGTGIIVAGGNTNGGGAAGGDGLSINGGFNIDSGTPSDGGTGIVVKGGQSQVSGLPGVGLIATGGDSASHSGDGVHGIGNSLGGNGVVGYGSGSGANGHYGVVGYGSGEGGGLMAIPTATTAGSKSAVNIVPQLSDPGFLAAGDLSMIYAAAGGDAKLVVAPNSSALDRYVPQSFASISNVTISSASSTTLFTIPANTLRAGSVIELIADGYFVTTGSQQAIIYFDLYDNTSVVNIITGIDSELHSVVSPAGWHIEGRATFINNPSTSSVCTMGGFYFVYLGSGPLLTPSAIGTLNTSGQNIKVRVNGEANVTFTMTQCIIRVT